MQYVRAFLRSRPPRSRVFRYTLTLRATVVMLLWALAGFGVPARLGVIERYGYGTFWLVALTATLVASPLLVLAAIDALWSARGRVVLGLNEIRYHPCSGKTLVIPYSDIESVVTARVREGMRPAWMYLVLEGGNAVPIRTLGLGRWNLFLRLLRERAGLEDEGVYEERDLGRKRRVPVIVHSRLADGRREQHGVL